MQRLQRSSVNMVFSMAGYAVPMLINFAITPLLLKLLGEAGYGLQSLVTVITGYLIVMDMGLDIPITKYLAEDHARKDLEAENHLLNTTFQLYIVMGILGMIILILFAAPLATNVFKVPADMIPSAVMVFRFAGLGFLGSMSLTWGRAVSMGLQRFEITHGISIIANIIGFALGIGTAYMGYGVEGFVLMRVLASFFASFLYWLFIRHFLPTYRINWGFDRSTLRRVSSYVGYGTINRAVSSLVSRLDQTLIGIWLGVAAAGIYAVPFMVVNSCNYMIANMLSFVFPLASELHSLGHLEALRNIFIRATKFITALGSMIYVPLFVLGDLFMKLWVGENMAEQTTTTMRWLIAAGFLTTLTASLTNNIVTGIGQIGLFTRYKTLRALVVGAGCFTLIRPLGLEGAALALFIATAVDILYQFVVIKRDLSISPQTLFRQASLAPIGLGLVLGCIFFFLRPAAHSWIGLIAVGGLYEVIYLVAGYFLGIFGETEIRAVLSLWNSVVNQLARLKARKAA